MLQEIALATYEKMYPKLSALGRQRAKIFLWGFLQYRPVMSIKALSLPRRLTLLYRCLRIDWCVEHCHWPGEAAFVLAAIGARAARHDEIVVEAGCWKGGSTAKWSILCNLLGYRLRVFDSFEGVESLPEGSPGAWFGGQYSAREEEVRENVGRYGEIGVCDFVRGWFSETLAAAPLQQPVRGVYLDCDLRKGTEEVLYGTIHALAEDGVICSQDYHLAPVRRLLDDPEMWRRLGTTPPRRGAECRNLVVLHVCKHAATPDS